MFPDRDTWAEQRRTAFADDLDQVVEAVSNATADYATADEITQADIELGEHWRALGRDLRAANGAAVSVFPLHGHRARRRASLAAIWRLRDSLAPADLAVVEAAERIKDHRARIAEVRKQLDDGHLSLWAISRVLENLPAGSCPTWRAIIGRWQVARTEAGDTYAEQVRQRPVDDRAWLKELDRRTEIRLWQASGHTRRSA